MSHTQIIKQGSAGVMERKRKKVSAHYERAREFAEQRVRELAPVDTGALKESSRAMPLSDRIGFKLRSFGSDNSGKSYALFVNFGHHTRSGGWIPANPYFSQAARDTEEFLAALQMGR